ncbi:MAG: hypothetical protein ACTSWN_06390 [Promethearchaeota archaeon]
MSPTLYFTNRIGGKKQVIPFPVDESLDFASVVAELCKKQSLNFNTISLASTAMEILTAEDFNKTVGQIIATHGENFEIVDAGDVGL